MNFTENRRKIKGVAYSDNRKMKMLVEKSLHSYIYRVGD